MFEPDIMKVAQDQKPEADSGTHSEIIEAAWLDLVRRQVASLRFGVVQIVVHESRVVQVERTERIRLDR